jgi:hypothetical protein
VSVYKKLAGANAVLSLDCLYGRPKPTLSGLGIISSSTLAVFVPAPNWICSVVGDSNLVTNLLGSFLNCNK